MSAEKKPAQNSNWWVWLALGAIVLLVAVVRIRLLDVPLERDEGEYAYAGQLLLQGIPPYKLAYNMKLPGIYAVYAAILALFGQTPAAIHFGLVLVNAATIIVTFFLGKKLFGTAAGLAGAGAFALLALGRHVQGLSANAEQFLILPAVGGLLLLLKAMERRGRLMLFSAALLLGAGFVIKQHGIAFIIFGAVYIVYWDLCRRPLNAGGLLVSLLTYAAGAVLPFALTCLLLWRAGVFEKFWFWTFDYAGSYVSSVPLSAAPAILKARMLPILYSSVLIWVLCCVGLVFVLVKHRDYAGWFFAAGLFLFSAIAVSFGFYFRPHYFVLALPAAAIFAGAGFTTVRDRLISGRGKAARVGATAIFAMILICYTIYQQRNYLVYAGPNEVSRLVYGANPFPESVEIGRFIKEHSKPDDRIAVIGSEPQIYFYANRRSATGYIYMYDLMAANDYALHMQREMVEQLEANGPEFLVVVSPAISSSWHIRSDSHKFLVRWLDGYIKENYEAAGLVDIYSMKKTEYIWGKALAGYQPRSKSIIEVDRRRKP